MMTAEKIREYQKANPSATARQVAEALKISPKYVHQIRWLDRGAKNRKTAKRPEAKVKQAKQAPIAEIRVGDRELLDVYKKANEDLRSKNWHLRVVISYYEQRMMDFISPSSKNFQHGASV